MEKYGEKDGIYEDEITEILEENPDKQEVKKQISEMKELFEDDPKHYLEEGTWFTKVLNKVLGDSKNLNAEYFSKKYVGLDRDNIAKKLIKTASNKAAIAGGSAGAVVTGLEIAIVPSLGTSAIAIGSTILGEFATITYVQLKLVYELSVLYNAKLDADDPEDLITIFLYTLGINKWEEASNAVLKVGSRSSGYLGRKALRQFKITKFLQAAGKKVGGQQLARKITEKGLLKLLVPGINILVAASMNKVFTNNLGKQAIKTFKNRSLAIDSLSQLLHFDRSFQLLTVPLIYYVGIHDVKKAEKVIEMQNITYKYLKTTEEEDKIINDLVLIEIEEFCELLLEINNEKVRHLLGYIAVLSYGLSQKKDQTSLNIVLDSLGVDFSNDYLKRIKKKIS
ncbi:MULTISPECIES: hypothetical protein [Psychrobacillus]|uniref:hypothetical protein n=1 Tax=Psychrobacillus TaxID=1221880 RepID=UPI0008F1A3C6|nr:hypothetical protein [Psychrobacillus psychrodurans]MCZ8540472.1 hypothetical protein [Psychrobacillus psychrodurans]SFM69606.1 hypothetical protein SAMN05421832_105203 [Psychrobacillus psychrodurans]